MLPGLELAACTDLAVPVEVMRHVVRVESGFNPYAIGVVGGRLVRQPRNRAEAIATAKMLEAEGFNFSLGIAQVNRHNLAPYGLDSYERAFDACANLQAGARILAECHGRAMGDWGKALSCYYSGDFATGFRHGYVQKVLASWNGGTQGQEDAPAIPLAGRPPSPRHHDRGTTEREALLRRRIVGLATGSRSDGEPDAVPAPGSQAPTPNDAAARVPAQAGPAHLQPGGAPPLWPGLAATPALTPSAHPPPPTAGVLQEATSANRELAVPRDAAFVF